ncbi:MAG: hypothetical protein A2X58_10020 [Nitrospirae bacterium GWC2_56_14]|nr:MAG: hypothetical protein A2X58_10020 [Nitrospirae bacterium GWC2_56_14]
MSNPLTIIFTQDSPFFEMVTAFLTATAGLGPIFEKEIQLAPGPDRIAWYRGKIKPDLAIDMGQIQSLRASGDLTADSVVKTLCCMLLCTAYTVADVHNDQSPEFEVFRHLRNAAAHGNYFYFKKDEPRRRAAWGRFVIDDKLKGSFNPLSGVECLGDTISPADVLALLQSIERRLPKGRNEQL